jgi:hypothetical protein
MSLVLISSFVLVGCGGTKVDAKLKADCDLIFENLQTIHKALVDLDVKRDDIYIAVNLGEQSRLFEEKKILQKFPFMDDIIVAEKKSVDNNSQNNFYAGTIFLIEMAIKGTEVEFPYSREEMISISMEDAALNNIVEPLATKIFGSGNIYNEEEFQGCDVVDKIRVDENDGVSSWEYMTDDIFAQASNEFWDIAGALQAIRNCKKSGWHRNQKCSKNDYVSEEEDYTPSTEMSDEERQILEERERAKENETIAPEQNSYAVPGQRCVDPDRVVQTEDYGELICRMIFLKGLVWVRT